MNTNVNSTVRCYHNSQQLVTAHFAYFDAQRHYFSLNARLLGVLQQTTEFRIRHALGWRLVLRDGALDRPCATDIVCTCRVNCASTITAIVSTTQTSKSGTRTGAKSMNSAISLLGRGCYTSSVLLPTTASVTQLTFTVGTSPRLQELLSHSP